MQKYDFRIVYKTGSKMLADYLPHIIVNAITWKPHQMQHEQELNPLMWHLKHFLLRRELLANPHLQNLTHLYGKRSLHGKPPGMVLDQTPVRTQLSSPFSPPKLGPRNSARSSQ
jgi:hypothetical protein